MDLRGRFAIAVLLIATACASEPATERSDLDAAAHELLALQSGATIFAEHFTSSPALLERMQWFRGAVGICDHVELDQSHGAQQGRFVYQCERGQFEAFIRVDDAGRVSKFLSGVRGVDPPARVREAAERWLESPAGKQDAAGCRIDRVDLGANTGAKFVMACPSGERTLVLDLNRSEEIRRLFIVDHATDDWRRAGIG